MRGLILLLSLVFSASAVALDVKQQALSNGLTVVVAEKPGSGLTWVGVVIESGSSNVPRSKEGLAYFTAKALLRGTETRTKQQIDETLARLGAHLEIDVEPSHTVFHAEVLARDAPVLVEILGDMISHPKLADADVETLRSELLGEIKIDGENDRGLARAFFVRELYTGSHGGFAKGTTAALGKITADDIRAFHGRHYGGANMFVAAAGDITLQRLSTLTQTKFSDVRRGAVIRVQPPKTKALDGIRVVLVDKADRTQTQIYAGHPVHVSSNPFPLLVSNNAFGGTFNARFNQEVRVKRGWSYGAYSTVHRDRGGYLSLWVYPGTKDTLETLKLTLAMFRTWHDKGITTEELERSRSGLSNEFVFQIETADQVMHEWIAHRVRGDDPGHLRTFRSDVEKVNLAAANADTQKNTRPDSLVIVMVCSAEDYVDAVAKLPGVREVVVIPVDAPDPDAARTVRPASASTP